MEQIIVIKEKDLLEAASMILDRLGQERVFALQGDLGAGKTTFIKAFCKVLGVEDQVSSPTFAIVNEYQTLDLEFVYHFDFYRIKNKQEAVDIGFDEYVYSGSYCFIEWPEMITELLPENFVYIRITETGKKGERFVDFNRVSS